MNGVIAAVLRTPLLHRLFSSAVLLITVTGRRSGRRYTIPVGYHLRGDVVTILVSEARKKSWWRNYREPGPVELWLWGRAQRGEAVVIGPEDPGYREGVEGVLRLVPGLGRVFGIDYRRGERLSPAQVEQLSRVAAVVRVKLEGGAP